MWNGGGGGLVWYGGSVVMWCDGGCSTKSIAGSVVDHHHRPHDDDFSNRKKESRERESCGAHMYIKITDRKLKYFLFGVFCRRALVDFDIKRERRAA